MYARAIHCVTFKNRTKEQDDVTHQTEVVFQPLSFLVFCLVNFALVIFLDRKCNFHSDRQR